MSKELTPEQLKDALRELILYGHLSSIETKYKALLLAHDEALRARAEAALSARAENARLRTAGLSLLQLCRVGGFGDGIAAQCIACGRGNSTGDYDAHGLVHGEGCAVAAFEAALLAEPTPGSAP